LSVTAKVQRNSGNFQSSTDVELLFEMPDKYVRTDMMGGGPMSVPLSTGFSGDKAIMPPGMRVMPGGGMMMTMSMGGPGGHTAPEEKPTPEQLEQVNKASLRNYRQEISRLMLGWFGSTHPAMKATYTYVGEAESPDGKAYVIDVKDEDGFASRLFIDQNSKLPLMVTFQGRAPRVMNMSGGPAGTTRVAGNVQVQSGQPGRQLTEEEVKKLREDAQKQMDALKNGLDKAPTVEISMFFEDWKEVDGINFPHTIRRASEGNTTEEWAINKVKVNPKIDAKKFETK
jgi:hypothetical protein